jgi:hypothetical protein
MTLSINGTQHDIALPFMLSVIMLNVVILNIIMLNVVKLNVIMSNVAILGVMVPCRGCFLT